MKRLARRAAFATGGLPLAARTRLASLTTSCAAAGVWMALLSGAAFHALPAHAADMNAVNNAAKIASGVGAGTAVPSLGVGAVLQTVVGLAVVIGLVFGCAWLARRLGLQPSQRGGLVKTIGGASLGGKERVAVVEIGDTWLVLGTAPGNVRLLHTMPAGSVEAGLATPGAAAAPGPLPGSFGQRFRDALKQEAGKRFQRSVSGEQ
ncbi:flagellar protein FliO/FliZ [Paraburkholderia sartisoli]|uniref:Flagellar protein n=2 Tax=Paraburkholderia sartisoli TaxID=83784 RepID=A0A1H4G6H1_9BURK|nr:flagellar protein FliO/FliZ [Paraburkholderia sartisoli]